MNNDLLKQAKSWNPTDDIDFDLITAAYSTSLLYPDNDPASRPLSLKDDDYMLNSIYSVFKKYKKARKFRKAIKDFNTYNIQGFDNPFIIFDHVDGYDDSTVYSDTFAVFFKQYFK